VYKTASAEGSVRVLPVGCVTKGREGTEIADLQALASAGAAAFSDDGSPITDDKIMRAALRYSRISGIPVIDHCEDPAMAAGGEMNAGWLAVQLGLRGVPAASEYVMVQRDIMLAMLTGGHVHIAHVSTEGSVELIRQAKQAGINITAEAAPHHLTLTEDAIGNCNANARVNPPLRTRSDVEALIRGLADGAIDCIATDHAPHTRGEKSRDFRQAPPGISGFETAFGSLMSLVHEGRFSLPRLIGWLTFRPAGIINHGELGTLKEGSAGDVTLIDPEREWTVNPHDFASRGKNTPLAGAVLKGKVMATVSAGRLVYRDSMTRITIRTG